MVMVLDMASVRRLWCVLPQAVSPWTKYPGHSVDLYMHMYTIYVLGQVLLFLSQRMQDTSYPQSPTHSIPTPLLRDPAPPTRRARASSLSPCFSRRHCTFHRRLGSVYFILRASCRLT